MSIANKLGSLEISKLADFNVISVPTPVFDPAASVVFACGTMNIDAVYVSGEKLVDHGELTRSDIARAASSFPQPESAASARSPGNRSVRCRIRWIEPSGL